MGEGSASLPELAQATGCHERGLAVLLDALCPLGLLDRDASGYRLTPTADAYLVRGRPAEAVRSGGATPT